MAITEKAVRESIIEQLEVKGIKTAALLSMVEEYMTFWKSARQLSADLKKNGAVIPYTTTSGCETTKPNPSLKELRDTNKQMIALAKHLELEPSKILSHEDDEM